jgi:hypothetical protein
MILLLQSTKGVGMRMKVGKRNETLLIRERRLMNVKAGFFCCNIP